MRWGEIAEDTRREKHRRMQMSALAVCVTLYPAVGIKAVMEALDLHEV
jgi:hypothetical protein